MCSTQLVAYRVFFKVRGPAIGDQYIVSKAFGHHLVNGICAAAFVDGNIRKQVQ